MKEIDNNLNNIMRRKFYFCCSASEIPNLFRPTALVVLLVVFYHLETFKNYFNSML